MGDTSSSVSKPPGTRDGCRATVGLDGVAIEGRNDEMKSDSYVRGESLWGDGDVTVISSL